MRGPRSCRTARAVALAAALAGLGLGVGCGPDTPPEPDPYAWTEAFPADTFGWLLNVWGPGASPLYAVGGAPDTGRAMRFDGTAWAEVSTGTISPPLLNWAFGFGPDDVTIVGNGGTVLHFDGARWTRQTTPTDQNLWGVWGAAPDDLWAVGGAGRAAGQATLLHYDGTAWTRVELPPLERPQVYALFKVWGTAADDVYVVGQRGLLLHWDGRVWTERGVGTSEDLIAIWGVARDRVVVVGGRANGVIVTWDGTDWRTRSIAPLPGLNGVWLRSREVFHVVGVGGTRLRVAFDDLAITDQQDDTNLDYHGVFGDAGGHLTAVGGNFAFENGPHRGIARRRALRPED